MSIIGDIKKLYMQRRRSPETFRAYHVNFWSYLRGCEYAERWPDKPCSSDSMLMHSERKSSAVTNPLREFFENNNEGPGIWKWEHYFEIYHRHLSPFVGKPVNVLEIGVYSGGSLNMWRSYFGAQSHIFGVDIEPACKVYERAGVTIRIGDQKDRTFWSSFKSDVKGIDVLIDDGGHKPEQQMVTLEEMLPHIRPGGVYLCEDIHGIHHGFMAFVSGLVNELNRESIDGSPGEFRRCVHSIHLYPYIMVIEKHLVGPSRLHAPKHGTEWQPFRGHGSKSIV